MRTLAAAESGRRDPRNQSLSGGRPDINCARSASWSAPREGVGEHTLHELAEEPAWATGVPRGHTRPAQLGPLTAWELFDAKALAL